MLEIVRVGGKENQSAKTRGTNCIALGDRLRRVANSVQRVGCVADFLWQTGHLRDAARIICHWTKSVEGDNHAGKTKHRRHSNRGSIKTAEFIGQNNAQNDDKSRSCR